VSDTVNPFPVDGHEFALCLTHDVDRPYKGIQGLYYALRDRRLHHLRSLRPETNPWWTFEHITDIERGLDVRSAFYFLREPHLLRDRSPREWLRPYRWKEHLGRYDPSTPEMADLIRELDRDGWEIGLHGSLGSHRDVDRLRQEKEVLEEVLGREVHGGRQHWLRHDGPSTWERQAAVGLRYDASLGSSERVGFYNGYDVCRPFEDEFVVFPLTVMDKALARRAEDLADARRICEALLTEARENEAVMTVLWHPRFFSEQDFPEQADLYRHVVERALDMGAWVGPPGDLYRRHLRPDDQAAEDRQSAPPNQERGSDAMESTR
jgi:peptidoglycan/xylan/chitin deacetylase (PgdA/CDA1 family)